MSSARNHAKRSRYSEARKSACFQASARRAYVSQAYRNQRQGIFRRMARLFRRPARETAKEAQA